MMTCRREGKQKSKADQSLICPQASQRCRRCTELTSFDSSDCLSDQHSVCSYPSLPPPLPPQGTRRDIRARNMSLPLVFDASEYTSMNRIGEAKYQTEPTPKSQYPQVLHSGCNAFIEGAYEQSVTVTPSPSGSEEIKRHAPVLQYDELKYEQPTCCKLGKHNSASDPLLVDRQRTQAIPSSNIDDYEQYICNPSTSSASQNSTVCKCNNNAEHPHPYCTIE